MELRQICVMLDRGTLDVVDAKAATCRVGRSAMLRMLLNRALVGDALQEAQHG